MSSPTSPEQYLKLHVIDDADMRKIRERHGSDRKAPDHCETFLQLPSWQPEMSTHSDKATLLLALLMSPGGVRELVKALEVTLKHFKASPSQ